MVLSYFTSYVYPSSSSSSSGSSNKTVRRDWKSPIYGPQVPPHHPSSSSSAKGKGRARDGEDGSSSSDPHAALTPRDPALAVIDYINSANSLYEVVGIDQKFTSTDEVRRAYMARCRVCHPDKFPHYADEATSAFQRVSLAYETLSKPSSRRAYDLSGLRNGGFGNNGTENDPVGGDFGEETLHSVLYNMYCDFLEKGDFEMVRVLVEALNASNPGLNLGEEAIEGIEGALTRLRGLLLSGAKHFRIVKFELIRLYEIQHDLRQLSYFDVFGRLRLSLQLARVTLSIPMVIDKAMKEEAAGDEYDGDTNAGPNGFVEDGDADAGSEEGKKDKQMVQRGLLGPRIASVLGLAVAVLEKGERII